MSTLLDPLIVKLVSDINTPYTSCYCEENVYLASQTLVASASQSLQDIYVVIISNSTKTVSKDSLTCSPSELIFYIICDCACLLGDIGLTVGATSIPIQPGTRPTSHLVSIAHDCSHSVPHIYGLNIIQLPTSIHRDYHVIMVLVAVADDSDITCPTLADRTYVVDFDSSLGTLTSWKGNDACAYYA
jgi:hypothetical protein